MIVKKKVSCLHFLMDIQQAKSRSEHQMGRHHLTCQNVRLRQTANKLTIQASKNEFYAN